MNTKAITKFELPIKPKQTLIDKRTAPLLKQARMLEKITSEDHYTVAGTIVPRIDEATKWIEAVSTPFVQALDRLHKMGVAWKKSLLNPLAMEKRRLLDLRQNWDNERRKIAEQAAQKLALGLQKEEKKELEKQAKAAEKQGDTESAAVLRDKADRVALPAVPTPAPVSTPGFYTRERWIYEIVDPALVEREFCSPDDSLIRPVVEALGPLCKISGLKITKEEKQHSRAVNE